MSSDRTVSSKPQPEPTPAQQAETIRNALQALTDYVDESPDVFIDTELAKRISVARAALRAALPVKQCSNGCAPHESCPQSRAAVSGEGKTDRLRDAADDDPLWDSSKAGTHGCACCREGGCSPACGCHERFVVAPQEDK